MASGFAANEYVVPQNSRFIRDTIRIDGADPTFKFSLETFEDDGTTAVDRRKVTLGMDSIFQPTDISIEFVTTFSFFGKTLRTWHDDDFDMTADRQEFDLEVVGTVDSDMDGTGDGTMDGRLDIVIYDDEGGSNDGTADLLEFVDGNSITYILSGFDLEILAGISEIDLSGHNGFRDGVTNIEIGDEDSTALAGGASGYRLVIDGGRNDNVTLNGIVRASGVDSTDDEGRVGYRGSDGLIFVDPDVAVVVV